MNFMSKPLIPAVPLSVVLTTLWINWELGVALVIIILSFGCLACHAWLCIRTVRSRLQEIPEDKRSHVRLLIIRDGIRARLPLLFTQEVPPPLSLSFRNAAEA